MELQKTTNSNSVELAATKSQNFYSSKLKGVDLQLFEAECSAPIFAMGMESFKRELKKIIIAVCTAHGIKTLPSVAEEGQILTFIMDSVKYRTMSTNQLKLAFDLNLMGEFGEPVKHFQLFSLEFICEVLNRFIGRNLQARSERKLLVAPYETKLTEEEIKNILAKKPLNAILYFDKFCIDENCQLNNPTDIFLYLESEGLINETTESKLEIYEQARQKRLIELKSLDPTDFRNSGSIISLLVKKMQAGENPESEKGMIKTIAREITLRKWFKKWKDEGFDLTGKLLIK